jgi:hypothetical protein
MRRTPRLLLLGSFLCVASAGIGAASGGLVTANVSPTVVSHAAPWRWDLTDARHVMSFGRLRSPNSAYGASTDLVIDTGGPGSLNGFGSDVVLGASDGTFELEHGPSANATRLSTVAIGAADGQDVVPLLVSSGDTQSLQVWSVGGRRVAVVRPDGGIVSGGVELTAGVDASGRVVVEAVLPNGTRQTLLVGHTSP